MRQALKPSPGMYSVQIQFIRSQVGHTQAEERKQKKNIVFHNLFSDFDGNGKPDNITFMIKRIKVHNMSALNDSTYRFPGNYGVEKFLELFSGIYI
jgi:hypothetical protein